MSSRFPNCSPSCCRLGTGAPEEAIEDTESATVFVDVNTASRSHLNALVMETQTLEHGYDDEVKKEVNPPPQTLSNLVLETLTSTNGNSVHKPSKDSRENEACEADLGWMNYMIKVMWPKIRDVAIAKGTSEIKERVAAELAKKPDLGVTEVNVQFDPGNIAPHFTGLRVYRKGQQEFEGLQIDADLIWNPGDKFKLIPTLKGEGTKGKWLSNLGKGFGVSGLEIDATVSCVLAPLVDKEPCFGAQQIFFIDTPGIRMQIAGLDRFGQVGKILTGILKSVVNTVLQDSFILPHNLMMKTRKDLPLETLTTVKSPLPIGLLEIEVIEARDLIAADMSLTGKASSDPYVEVRVGQGKMRTSTVSNSVNPTWTDGPDYMLVYNLAQMVRIEVFDDDTFSDDILGQVMGYNVYWLCHKAENIADGVWFELSGKSGDSKKNYGKLRIRLRYLDVTELGHLDDHNAKSSPRSDGLHTMPHLVTVKLLGVEGENTGLFLNSRATVDCGKGTSSHSKSETQEEAGGKETAVRRLRDKGARAWEKATAKLKTGADKFKAVTGIGFGNREFGVPTTWKSGKAKLWGETLLAPHGQAPKKTDNKASTLPGMVIRAIEQLHNREEWTLEQIAQMFGVDIETVQAAASLRANFEVVWHEACHFVLRDGPYNGYIQIEVRGSKEACQKASKGLGLIDKDGLIGTCRLHLHADPIGSDKLWKRRVRAVLRRPSLAKDLPPADAEEDLGSTQGEGQCEKNMGDPVPGALIEFMVEIRALEVSHAAKHLEEGQSPGDQKTIFDQATSRPSNVCVLSC